MSTYVENGEGIFGLSQGLSVLWRDVGFVAAESNPGSVADGEGETKSHELPCVKRRARSGHSGWGIWLTHAMMIA